MHYWKSRPRYPRQVASLRSRLWLSHTQVRVVAVGQEHNAYCEKVLAELSANQIRADLDDRDETVGKKVREI